MPSTGIYFTADGGEFRQSLVDNCRVMYLTGTAGWGTYIIVQYKENGQTSVSQGLCHPFFTENQDTAGNCDTCQMSGRVVAAITPCTIQVIDYL